jgi:signal transduction histidine kinase
VIVRTILTFHSGFVDFKSELGAGTEFFFDVPAHIESAAQRPHLAMVREG